MKKAIKWIENENVQGYLIAMDIVAFGTRDNPNGFLDARMDLVTAVESSVLFPKGKKIENIKVQFIGDELIFGLYSSITALDTNSFIETILYKLGEMNKSRTTDHYIQIRGVVLHGLISFKHWRGVNFFSGPLMMQKSLLMPHIGPGEIVINNSYRTSLISEGFPSSDCIERRIGSEIFYLLNVGADK